MLYKVKSTLNKNLLEPREKAILDKYKNKDVKFMAILFYGLVIATIFKTIIDVNNSAIIINIAGIYMILYLLVIIKYIIFKLTLKNKILKEMKKNK